MAGNYDRASEVKAFDEMKIGVTGLVEAGITKIPKPESQRSHNPLVTVTNLKPSSTVVMIPTIDLRGGVFESMAVRESVVAKVKDAMEKFGFFKAINHGIPLDMMEKMRNGIRGFHEQDPEVRKMFYSRDKTKKFKYNSNSDIYESPAASWRDSLTCVMAPDVPKAEDLPEICGEIMLEYTKEVMKLGELMFELLSEALGLSPNHLKEMDCAKGSLLLCHCFPPCPEPDKTFGVPQHTDRSFLSILLPDHTGGLQVLHDGSWIDVSPDPQALIFNIGDLLQLITNDKFVSVEHKVLANRGEEPRISVTCYFVHTQPSSRVYGPIKELLSEQNPPKYKGGTAEASFHYVARKLNVNASLEHLRI